MFKAGDKVIVVRPESTRRQRTKLDPPGAGDWIDSKPKMVERKAVISQLGRLYIPVRLPSGEIKHCLYVDLTFLKSGKVSFKSKKADWKGVKKDAKGIYREVLIPGKPIVIRGEVVLHGLYIPVLLDGKAVQIPYENLKFKEQK